MYFFFSFFKLSGFFCGYSFSMCFVVFVLSIFFYLGSRYFVKFCSFRLICEVLLICSVNSCSFFAYELYISVTYIGWYFILTVLYFTCQNSFVFYIFFYVTFCSVCSFVVSCSFAHLIYVHYMLLLFISIIFFFPSDDPEYIWVGELTHFSHVQ